MLLNRYIKSLKRLSCVALLMIALSGYTLSQSLPLTLSSGRAIAVLESGNILLAGFTLTEREGAAPRDCHFEQMSTPSLFCPQTAKIVYSLSKSVGDDYQN